MGEQWDAIVVGLGPAGAAAAWHLARAGARVAVLAPESRRGKPCGGCISGRWQGLFQEMAAPDWLWRHPVNQLWLTGPGRPPAHWPRAVPAAWLVDRGRLDRWLARTAAGAGARIIPVRARGLERRAQGWEVRGGEGRWRADWLVMADGAKSLAGPCLGLGRTGRHYRAWVEEQPWTPPPGWGRGAVALELGGLAGGYGWLFPRDGVVNLGLGFLARDGLRRGPEALAAYRRFLARHGLSGPGRWRGWIIPYAGPRAPRVARGRACVAGDAAAVADPFLGEGIGQALYTGRLAARAIVKGDLGLYSRWLEPLWQEHRHAWALASMVYRLPGLSQAMCRRHPAALELGFNMLEGRLCARRLWSAVADRARDRQAGLDPSTGGIYSRLTA